MPLARLSFCPLANAQIASGISGAHHHGRSCRREDLKAAPSRCEREYLPVPCCRWAWITGAIRRFPLATAATTTKPALAIGTSRQTSGRRQCSQTWAGQGSNVPHVSIESRCASTGSARVDLLIHKPLVVLAAPGQLE